MQSCFLGKHVGNVLILINLSGFHFSFVFIPLTYRGNDGELRLGVRRAVQLKNEALLEAVNCTDPKLLMLSAVASSLDNRSIFHICFNPRSVYWCTVGSLDSS